MAAAVLTRARATAAQALDEQTGVSNSIKGTAQDLNERCAPNAQTPVAQLLLLPKRSCNGVLCLTSPLAARRLRITERTKAGAAALQAKARDLDSQFQIVEKSQALVKDTKAAAAGLLDKAKSHEAGQAVASAASSFRGFLSAAGAKAGDVVNAAKAKVETMAAESAVQPPSPAPAAQ